MVSEMFTDVYTDLPWNLKEQQSQLKEVINEYPDAFPTKSYVSFD